MQADAIEGIGIPREGGSYSQYEAVCKRNDELEAENLSLSIEIRDLKEEREGLEAQRDKFRNSLGERTEEVQGLRASNANLAGRILELQECQKDSRRMDWLDSKAPADGQWYFCPTSCKPGFTHNPEEGYSTYRAMIDATMAKEEEWRQDRISELQAELAKLCRESGE